MRIVIEIENPVQVDDDIGLEVIREAIQNTLNRAMDDHPLSNYKIKFED